MFTKILRIALLGLLGAAANSACAQAVTVVEYYNQTLDAYFITGRASEKQQLDVLPVFQRTGMSFEATASAPGTAQVCRFYVNSATPYANSHFYGLGDNECESLRVQQIPGFNWEGYDFALQRPVGGVCPSGTTTIYRSFRPAAGGKTANHRYSASSASYTAIVSVGYTAEQPTFCAAAATDVTVTAVSAAACGTFYYPGVTVGYQSLTDDGVTKSWLRNHAGSTATFNGRTVQPVIDQYASGETYTVMVENAADTWSNTGSRSESNAGVVEAYLLPAAVTPRRMLIGQRFDINDFIAYSPVQKFGSPHQTGSFTFVGVELVSVATGNYAACRFQRNVTLQYSAVDVAYQHNTTTWVAPGVGMVKSRALESRIDGFGPILTTTTDTTAVSVERL